MKNIIILSLFITFGIGLLYVNPTYAMNPTNCMIWDFVPQYEKYYPCTWTNEIVSWRDKSNAHSAIFKCRNVPTTATFSYTTTAANSNSIPYSVSLWGVNEPNVIDVTDVNLFNYFNAWANLGAGNRNSSHPQCLNTPDCLTTSSADKTLSAFPLGNSVGISVSTTYNMYILNENPNTYSSPPADNTDALNNCFALQVSLSIH